MGSALRGTCGAPLQTNTKLTCRARGLSKAFISTVISGVAPFRVVITLLITYLLSPLPLQVVVESWGTWGSGPLGSVEGPWLGKVIPAELDNPN